LENPNKIRDYRKNCKDKNRVEKKRLGRNK
jgi:hypothetical protein